MRSIPPPPFGTVEEPSSIRYAFADTLTSAQSGFFQTSPGRGRNPRIGGGFRSAVDSASATRRANDGRASSSGNERPAAEVARSTGHMKRLSCAAERSLTMSFGDGSRPSNSAMCFFYPLSAGMAQAPSRHTMRQRAMGCAFATEAGREVG